MNLRQGVGILRAALFRAVRAVRWLLPRQSIQAFGKADGRIESILVINLDRQPVRWRRIQRELNLFKAYDGRSLVELASRLPAIDARDGRETAPTADVDPIYLMKDQLFVQPDDRLNECFGEDERIRMTRQEIAVARSHIEAWKRIANGSERQVLILEDDAYFVTGAASLIDRGWRAALQRGRGNDHPQLLYISYLNAGGTAQRADVTKDLFRPVRGFWYLSGYVLSRPGAAHLLRSMPVVGPVDLWMNHRFAELDVVALARPALLQRPDGGSDNAYSILPYLARAGVVDGGPGPVRPIISGGGIVFAWNAPGQKDAMSMALSMLGYRVRSGFSKGPVAELLTTLDDELLFDAYVDVYLDQKAVHDILSRRPDARFVIMAAGQPGNGSKISVESAGDPELPPARTLVLRSDNVGPYHWEPLCNFLGLPVPDHAFPVGVEHAIGLFQIEKRPNPGMQTGGVALYDESPWVIRHAESWLLGRENPVKQRSSAETIIQVNFASPSAAFRALTETFPGNLATFNPRNIAYGPDGATLVLTDSPHSIRRFSSAALASTDDFKYGRFTAEIKAARGAGLITGFFLHRDAPRQEIDVELLGSDPCRMLVNVYFNPGDEGATMSYGYRGTPYLVDLGFDASLDFHTYTVEWTPAQIRWLVDDQVVHTRSRWNPTPIPHLPMRLYANLWSPRSVELAGQLQNENLPARSTFRQIIVEALHESEATGTDQVAVASDSLERITEKG